MQEYLRLEVTDKKNRIAFSIKYAGGHDVYLTGYFIDDYEVLVLNNTGPGILQCLFLEKKLGYLAPANEAINSIRTIFPEYE